MENILLNDNLLKLIAVFIVLVPYGLYVFCHALPNAITAEQRKKEQGRDAFVTCSRAEFEAQSLRKFEVR